MSWLDAVGVALDGERVDAVRTTPDPAERRLDLAAFLGLPCSGPRAALTVDGLTQLMVGSQVRVEHFDNEQLSAVPRVIEGLRARVALRGFVSRDDSVLLWLDVDELLARAPDYEPVEGA